MGDDINNSNPESLARITAEILYRRGYSVKLFYGKTRVFQKKLPKNNDIFIDIDEKNNVFWINTPETGYWSRKTHLSYLPGITGESLWITYPENLI